MTSTPALPISEVLPKFHYITESLRPLAVPLDDVHLDPANARTGHAVDQIAASLHSYKQRKPIVVNRKENNKIEAGNGTWPAAKALGWTHIAVVFVEDDPITAVGFGIADNRLGDLSEWDLNTLDQLMRSLDEDIVTGFIGDELEQLMVQAGLLVPDFQPVGEGEQPRLDQKAAITCPHCGQDFIPE